MAIVIAGERSGSGKTTITLALLSALRQQHQSVQSFKVGPDYIDPMFHTAATGRPCRNLDPVLTSERYVQDCFAQHTQSVDCAVVEGVMGLFDGAGSTDFASTAHIARLLELPIALVIDCAHLSRSVAAIATGYRSFDPQLHLVGVILNRVASDRHLTLLQEALASIHMPILGVFYRNAAIAIPDRHLGLVPTEELGEWATLQDRLAHLGQESFDWQQLQPFLTAPRSHPSRERETKLPTDPESCHGQRSTQPVEIAIARDRAFNFYYADNLDSLITEGATLRFWSPLGDTDLPNTVQGLYFGGGFPELFAAGLAQNTELRQSLRRLIQSGIPTYAECGGLMYLSQEIIDFQHQAFPMVGILPTTTKMTPKLSLGYRRAQSLQSSPICTVGAIVTGHEFHRSQLTQLPPSPLFSLKHYLNPEASTPEGWGMTSILDSSIPNSLHASYLHLHWGARPEMAQRFVQQCQAYWAKSSCEQ